MYNSSETIAGAERHWLEAGLGPVVPGKKDRPFALFTSGGGDV